MPSVIFCINPGNSNLFYDSLVASSVIITAKVTLILVRSVQTTLRFGPLKPGTCFCCDLSITLHNPKGYIKVVLLSESAYSEVKSLLNAIISCGGPIPAGARGHRGALGSLIGGRDRLPMAEGGTGGV